MHLSRRALAALAGAGVVLGRRALAARSPTAGLAGCLHALLPPGLDPAQLGAAVRAGAAERPDLAGCLAHAAVPAEAQGWGWVAPRVAADFAAGRTVAAAGWQLATTEAWLCAALHCDR